MKVVELRTLKIEPEIGEEVTVETNEYTYSCIAEKIKDISCGGGVYLIAYKSVNIYDVPGVLEEMEMKLYLNVHQKKEGSLKMRRLYISDKDL
nr:MAG: hypothetical protein [Bacteriophage sp.]